MKRPMIALAVFLTAIMRATAQEPAEGGVDPVEAAVHSPAERDGRRLAAGIAAVYWQHEAFAETLHEAQAELGFIADILDQIDAPSSLPADLERRVKALREAVRARVRSAGEATNVFALLERAPAAGNLMTQYIRYGAGIETAQELLVTMAPTVGPAGIQPAMYDYLAAEVAERRATPEDDPTGEDALAPADPQLHAAFEARYARWIETVRLLGRLEGRDQFARYLIIGQITGDLDPQVRQVLIEANRDLIDTIDAENTAAALAIMDTNGFAALNREAPRAATLIAGLVHHSDDLAAKRRVLAEIEPLARAGEFSPQRYALNFDRVAMNAGEPQRYGTQMTCVDGDNVIHTLEDPERVDELRAEMGLGPLEDYRSDLLAIYGAEC